LSEGFILVFSTFPISLLALATFKFTNGLSGTGAFAVRTFYFLTSSAKVTYAPGYESLYNSEKLNSMHRF
jgi:hypothetical protein